MKLPEIGREAESGQAEVSRKSLWRTTSFTVGLLSLFLYVAAQTGINSFFINYATENAGVSAQEASVWLSFGGMGLFMAGRMGGSWLMRFVKEKVLAVCAAGACVCMAAVILMPGGAGWYFLLLCFYVNRLCFLLFFLIFAPRWHTNQTGFFLSDYVDCRRSSGSLVNGAHSRPYFHGSGIYRTADLLYGNLGIRSKIQKTIVIVLSHTTSGNGLFIAK